MYQSRGSEGLILSCETEIVHSATRDRPISSYDQWRNLFVTWSYTRQGKNKVNVEVKVHSTSYVVLNLKKSVLVPLRSYYWFTYISITVVILLPILLATPPSNFISIRFKIIFLEKKIILLYLISAKYNVDARVSSPFIN